MPTMNPFSPDEEISIAEAFLVANTAPSLYRWLERNDAIMRIANNLLEDDLIDLIQQHVTIKPRTEIEVGKAYAFLVAMILKRRQKGSLGSLPISPEALRWCSHIWEIARRGQISTTQETIPSQKTPPLLTTRGDSGAIPEVIFDHCGKPIIRIRR